MTTQSGITPSSELLSAWSEAISSPSVRVVKIAIESESLVLEERIDAKGSFEDDFDLMRVEPDVPAYVLLRLEETSSSQWVFYSWVPDAASVRPKMLYASTRATLIKSLGDSRISTSIFATALSDMTHASYLSHLTHSSSAAPLTAREQEMADIKKAERAAGNDAADEGRAGQPVWSGAVGLGWNEEAKELVEGLAKNDTSGALVLLEVDTKKEEVIAAASQPTSLSLPQSTPSYTFFRHSRGIVFIYSCPSSSPIKSRLLYSSSAGNVVNTAKSLGIEVAKKIETSSPEEIDIAFIEAEFGPQVTSNASDGAPAGSAPLPPSEKVFAKPARPGRKR